MNKENTAIPFVVPTMNDIPKIDIERIYRSSKSRAKRFAKRNCLGSYGMTEAQLMNHQIRNSGFTCEDIVQELCFAGCEAWLNSSSSVEKERFTFILNAIDWKANGLAASIFANCRGAQLEHVAGDDTQMIFEGLSREEEA